MNIRDHRLEDGIFARSWTLGGDRWCVLLHDALGCVELWRDFPEKLSRHSGMNVFAYDRPGHGQSRESRNPRSIDLHDCEGRLRLPKVLQSAGIGRISLIGHSDGASIALCYASAYPDQVESLIVYGAHIDVDAETIRGLKEVRSGAGNADRTIQKLERYHGRKAQLLYKQWLGFWLNEKFAARFNLAPRLHSIKCPCLIFQGEMDEYADRDHPLRIRRAIGKNAHAMIIPELGHFPHVERPELTLGLILGHFSHMA